jgi:nucleotide-binding universal stress UspA family protein
VLVGTDLSDFANQAIPAAYALLTGIGGRVEICHLHETPRGVLPSLPPATLEPSARAALEARLASLVPAEAAGRGIRTALVVREAESAAEGLRQEAERCDADVVVVASHGRRGLSRALMGSVAEQLTRRTTRPVLVLHPPER